MVIQFHGEIDKDGRIQIPDNIAAKAGIEPGSSVFVVLYVVEPFTTPVVVGYSDFDRLLGIKFPEHKESWNDKFYDRVRRGDSV